MRFSYADPPYFGCAAKLYGSSHPDAAVYDTLEGHAALIKLLCTDFPDGWALSMTSGNLHDILPLCPRDSRIGAWVKPFAAFKPNVGVAYAWEPVVFLGGRRRTREQPTVRDWFSEPITLQRGCIGAKPSRVVHWILEMLGAQPSDEVVDLFPGSGAVTEALDKWRANPRLFT